MENAGRLRNYSHTKQTIMIHLITYSSGNMDKAAALCVKSAEANGVDWSDDCNDGKIDVHFEAFNRSVLNQERGAGYWLWKPYLIYKWAISLNEGDILIYSDAGVEFINNVNHIIENMDQDIFLFGNNYPHLDWCKADVREAITPNWSLLMDADSKQVQASVIFIRVSEFSRRFIKEWLLWCQMPGFIDDSPSVIPNCPTFQEHRHDQAILTCLAYKYGIKLHYWAAQYNNGQFVYDKLPDYKEDNYPIIFHHHRKRDNEW